MRKSRPPSQRQLRVGEEIKHILAAVLLRGQSGDPLIDTTSVTISEVRVSPDFQNATVFVLPLGGKQLKELLAALKENRGYFRKELARQMRLRVVPRLSFQADLSFDEAERIEILLHTPRVRRDIEKSDEE